MELTQNKKNNKLNIAIWSRFSKRLLGGIHCFTISICDFVYEFNDGANYQREGTTYLQGID